MVGLETRFSAEVRGRGCGGGGSTWSGSKGFLDKVRQGTLVDACAQDSNVSFREGGGGERLDVRYREGVVCWSEEGLAKAGTEGKGVRNVNGTSGGIFCGCFCVSFYKTEDVFFELVAGELG